MNPEYTFKYRRLNCLFFKKIKVIGNRFIKEMDRMDLFLPDGTIFSVPEWSRCELSLGKDWLLAEKTRAEKESGQSISLAVKDNL